MSKPIETRLLRMLAAGLVVWPLGLWAWTPGTYPAGSRGFTVDAQDRNDVVSFWYGIYQASEGYQNRHGWSGNYTAASPYTNAEGTTAAVFAGDVERRLNFFRALCQIPAGARVNTGASVLIDPADPLNLYHPGSSPPLASATTKAAAAQRAAYMLIRTYGYSLNGALYPPLGNAVAAMVHAPLASNCVAWTTAAWNANHHGNLALGFYGPGALDAYMAETVSGVDSWNTEVGHRRWLLYPGSTDFASGDTPGSFDPGSYVIRPPSNVLYVVPKASEVTLPTPQFVPYPAAGYFPAALNSRLWSLSYPGAGFATATVTMTTAGGAAVPVVIKTRGGNYGSPALVWQVPDAQAVTTVTADTTYHVTVGGITGTGVPSSYGYAVTLINPAQLTSDQALFGPGAPPTNLASTYQITPASKAEAMQVNCFQPVATAWTEGAEDTPTPKVIANTTGTYALRWTGSYASDPGFTPISGSKSFHLTIPVNYDPLLNGVPDQSFELDREILPNTSASLNFKFQRGYMTKWTKLMVETSADGGACWLPLGSAICGNLSNVRDSLSTTEARTLTASSVPLRVRFRLSYVPNGEAGQGFYSDQTYPTYPTGMFLDDISTTNCQWLDLKKTNDLSASTTDFVFNSSSAGMTLTNGLELRLRLRTKLGNRWMPYGPMKALTLSTADPTESPELDPPGVTQPAGQVITITSESNATIYYRLNGGAEQAAASPVSNLSVPTDGSTLTITAYARKAGKSDSEIVSANYASSPFATWMNTSFPGITDANTVGPAADPDNDGQNNALEFALGGDPAAAGGRARVYNLTLDGGPVGGDAKPVVLTIAVRAGTPAFTGTPAPAATCDGMTYTIQGGTDPGSFSSPVAVTAAVTTGLPAAPAGYEYRSFKLDVPEGPPPNGFLRVRVTSLPE